MERLNLNKKVVAAAATLAMFAGAANAHLEVYGEVNELFQQVWTKRQDTALFSSNNYSPSKLGAMGSAHLNKCVTFGGVTELEFIPNNTRVVSQIRTEDHTNHIVYVRKVDAWIAGGMWGTLRIGLGESASWNITNISFSGTNQTSLGSSVANNFGGGIFAVKGSDATLLDPTVNAMFNAMNGIGDVNQLSGVFNTQNRVRYDTADFMGFNLSASYGHLTKGLYNSFDSSVLAADGLSRKEYADIALRYSGCWDDFMVGFGIAGGWMSRDGATYANLPTYFTAPTAGSTYRNEKFLSGSLAVEHKPSGINVAAAAGVKRKFNSFYDNHKFWYVQLGKHFCLTDYGRTDVAIDYFGGKSAVWNGDKARSYSLGVTQHFNKINSALYASLRNYNTTGTPRNYEDIFVASVGVQFKFGAML